MRQLVRGLTGLPLSTFCFSIAPLEHRRDVIGIEQIEYAFRRAGLLD